VLLSGSPVTLGAAGQVALPFWLAAAGILCSMIGFFFVSTKEEGAGETNMGALMFALEKGMYSAGFLFLGSAAVICWALDEMWDEVGFRQH
jgi:Na+/H+-translocating membrane pyrophosphatase